MFPFRSGGRLVLVGAMCVGIAGCLNSASKDADTSLTNTEPQFVVVNRNPKPDTVLVFVHGIFGDTVGTWRHADGTGFFELVNDDPDFRGRFDAFAFGFSSYYLSQGSYSIREAAKRLKLHADIHLKSYKRLIFVAHSMGGLVTMRYLLADSTMAKRVPVIVLFATPQDPNQVASIFRHVLNNDALFQMSDAKENTFFSDLDDDWKGKGHRPEISCAYEKLATGPVVVVPSLAASRYCNDPTPPIAANHINIVKPATRGHDSYLVLARALKKHAMTPAPPISSYSEDEDREIKKIEGYAAHNLMRFPSEALKDAKMLNAKFPNYANGFRLTGIAYWNQGEFRSALDAYSTALKLDPEPGILFKLKLNRIASLIALGRITDAQPLLAELAKDNPDDELVRVLLALEKLLTGDHAAARSRLQELSYTARLPGSLPFVKMAQGFSRALGRSSDADDREAIELWKEAVGLEPEAGKVFSAPAGPIVIEGWNYAIFREMLSGIRGRPAFQGLTFAAQESGKCKCP